MKLLKVKRNTKIEARYGKRMGCLLTPVTKIKLYLLNILPIKTIYEYRETYYGEIKELKNCNLNA
jgi:hypothetical protein